MGRTKFVSPTLNVAISMEEQDAAIQSNSGGCLWADAIQSRYPKFNRAVVDMATIRISDPEKGVRYTYLTPPAIQHSLLSFDQGWDPQYTEAVIKRAVHIAPMVRDRNRDKKAQEARSQRLSELEAKMASGEKLDRVEKQALTKLKARKKTPRPERAPYAPPVEVGISVGQGSGRGRPVIYGGRRPVQGPAHPNLLRGRDRHFGAKLANPGVVFEEAVEAAVKERLTREAREAASES